MLSFEYILQKKKKETPIPHVMVTLDPGETTGWSLWIDGEVKEWGQISSKGRGNTAIHEMFGVAAPYGPIDVLVVEDYRVYATKSEVHIGKELITPKIIGKLEYVAEERSIPLVFQMAVEAKRFATDDKLKRWGFWKKGMRHSRDALRHGIFYLLIRRK